MKALKWTGGILLIIIAVALLVSSISAQSDLEGLLKRLDAQNVVDLNPKMLADRDRVLESHLDNDRDRTLRNLDRYLERHGDLLLLEGTHALELTAFRSGPIVSSVGVLLMAIGAALLATVISGKAAVRKAALYAVGIVLLYVCVYVVEQIAGTSSMLVTVLKKGAIYALLAVSMNLLNGFTGLFSLGQAGFMLIGAYTNAMFTIPVESRGQVYQYYAGGLIQFQMPVILAIILAGLVAAFFAYLIGLPVLRLKSDYLAIATLGFAEIIRAVFQYDGLGPITNGSNLLRRFTTFNSALFPFIAVGICILLIILLINSTYGRAFKAIRDDEVAAEAMGINLPQHKSMAFVISCFFAGVGGALLAMYQTTVQASAFKASMTYEILLIVVLGGMGSVSGSVIASFLFIAASEWWLRFLDAETVIGTFEVPLLRSGFRMVVFSVIVMLVVLFYQKGIMGDRELSLDMFKRNGKEKRGGRNA